MNRENLSITIVERQDKQQLAVGTSAPLTNRQLALWQRIGIDALLVLVTIIWGSSFLIVQDAIRLVGPFTFLAMRFGIGAVVLVLAFYKHFRRITRRELVAGSIIGLFLFAGYALQTLGLQTTSTSMTGFLTGLYVPLVPLLSIFILRQRLKGGVIAAIFLSFLGLILLSLNENFRLSFGSGELLILGCAIAYALHIVVVSRFALHGNAINISIVQIALTALLSLFAMPLAHERLTMPPLAVWSAALYLGIGATAFGLLAMNRVQQFVSSVRATLIYALEPVWTALLGFLIGERLSTFAWIGCLCILLAMLVGSIRLNFAYKRARRMRR